MDASSIGLDVFGAHIQFGRYYAADASRGQTIQSGKHMRRPIAIYGKSSTPLTRRAGRPHINGCCTKFVVSFSLSYVISRQSKCRLIEFGAQSWRALATINVSFNRPTIRIYWPYCAQHSVTWKKFKRDWTPTWRKNVYFLHDFSSCRMMKYWKFCPKPKNRNAFNRIWENALRV